MCLHGGQTNLIWWGRWQKCFFYSNICVGIFWATLKWSFYVSFVRRPPIRPTKKNFSWHGPCPTSDIRPGADPIQWGKCGVNPIYGRTEGPTCTPTPAPFTPNPTPSYLSHQEGPNGAPSGGLRAEGGRQRALSDGGRRTDESFYFFLELPGFFVCVALNSI